MIVHTQAAVKEITTCSSGPQRKDPVTWPLIEGTLTASPIYRDWQKQMGNYARNRASPDSVHPGPLLVIDLLMERLGAERKGVYCGMEKW